MILALKVFNNSETKPTSFIPQIGRQIVRIEIENDWHTVADNSGHGVWRHGQNRAGSHCVAAGVLAAIPNPCESEQLAFVDFETIMAASISRSSSTRRTRGRESGTCDISEHLGTQASCLQFSDLALIIFAATDESLTHDGMSPQRTNDIV
jgi:hypothetical protein